MVCYGQENNGQAYGGGIIYASRNIHPKPCYLRVLVNDQIVGVIYIYFNNPTISYHRYSGNVALRVIIYGR